MIKYKIMSCEACEKYAQQKHNNVSVVVSIYSPFYSVPNVHPTDYNGIQDVLYLPFCDDDIDTILQWHPTTNGLMTDIQAKQIFDFCQKWYDKIDVLIFHCDGGISRSAGCAAAIMRWFEGYDYPIFNMKSKHPNMYCYNKVLDACRGIVDVPITKQVI